MKNIILLIISLLLFSAGKKKDTSLKSRTKIEKSLQSKKSNHQQWNGLLKKHVDEHGNVDYKKFKKDIPTLDEYLKNMSLHEPSANWSKNEKLAYYINLYNAATVKLILDHYPIPSIKNITNPWSKKRVTIGNKKWSLGDIEHKILRKMDEPRIHFAINCASYSCPKLSNQAYTPDSMEIQLQEATLSFINDTTKNKISAEKIKLSKIFKWYTRDFTNNNSLLDYISTASKKNIPQNLEVTYLEYNWSLNENK